MINKLLLCLIGLLACTTIQAQSLDKVDSLLALLPKEKSPRQLVGIYNLLGKAYQSFDSTKTAFYTSKAIQIADRIHFLEGKIDALNCRIRNFTKKKHFAPAQVLIRQASTLIQQTNYLQGKSDLWHNKGWWHMKKRQYAQSQTDLEKAIHLKRQLKDQEGLGNAYNTLGILFYFQDNYPKALEYYQQCLAIRKTLPNKKNKASIYYNIGMIYRAQGQYDKALKYYKYSLKLKKEIKDTLSIFKNLNDLGIIYHNQGLYPQALEYYLQTLKIAEKRQDQNTVALAYHNLGSVHYSQKEYNEALDYLQKALKIRREIKYWPGITSSLNSIGSIYVERKAYTKALTYLNEALSLAQKINSKRRLLWSYRSLGKVYLELGQFQKTLSFLEKGLVLSTKLTDQKMMASFSISLGQAYLLLKKFSLSEQYLQKGLVLATKIKYLKGRSLAASYLAKLYKTTHRYQLAYDAQVVYQQTSDSLLNQKNIQKISRLEAEYEFQKEKEVLNKTNLLQAAKLEKEQLRNHSQHTVIMLISALLLAMGIFAGFVYRSQRKQYRLNRKLTQQTRDLAYHQATLENLNEELTQNHDEIEAQRNDLEYKNASLLLYQKRIEQSFRSARLIQNSLLPTKEDLECLFADCFVLYQPKDVVSGDFYWMNKINKKHVLVVADCTGHGVPGAFMTLIGTKLLDNIVKIERVSHPVGILKRLNHEIKLALHQDEPHLGCFSQGGMDAAVIVLEPKEDEIQINFAGAKSGFMHYDPDTQKIYEQRGSRKSIGGLQLKERKFESKVITLKKGSILYLGSDGLADQNNARKQKFGLDHLK